MDMTILHRLKQLSSIAPFGLTHRLGQYILSKSLAEKATMRWTDLGKKDLNRLINTLIGDSVSVTGRAPFHDEFVTCGGVSLKSILPTTLESRSCPGLYLPVRCSTSTASPAVSISRPPGPQHIRSPRASLPKRRPLRNHRRKYKKTPQCDVSTLACWELNSSRYVIPSPVGRMRG